MLTEAVCLIDLLAHTWICVKNNTRHTKVGHPSLTGSPPPLFQVDETLCLNQKVEHCLFCLKIEKFSATATISHRPETPGYRDQPKAPHWHPLGGWDRPQAVLPLSNAECPAQQQGERRRSLNTRSMLMYVLLNATNGKNIACAHKHFGSLRKLQRSTPNGLQTGAITPE